MTGLQLALSRKKRPSARNTYTNFSGQAKSTQTSAQGRWAELPVVGAVYATRLLQHSRGSAVLAEPVVSLCGELQENGYEPHKPLYVYVTEPVRRLFPPSCEWRCWRELILATKADGVWVFQAPGGEARGRTFPLSPVLLVVPKGWWANKDQARCC